MNAVVTPEKVTATAAILDPAAVGVNANDSVQVPPAGTPLAQPFVATA